MGFLAFLHVGLFSEVLDLSLFGVGDGGVCFPFSRGLCELFSPTPLARRVRFGGWMRGTVGRAPLGF